MLTLSSNSFCVFFLSAYAYLVIYEKRPRQITLPKLSSSKSYFALFGLCLLIFIVAYPLVGLTAYINESINLPNRLETIVRAMTDAQYQVIDYMLSPKSFDLILLGFITMVVSPALFEEFTFRYVLQNRMRRYLKANIHLAVFLSSFLFSLIHLDFYGFLPRIFLGMLLGYVYIYTQTIWASVFFHAINNGLAFFVAHIYGVEVAMESYTDEHMVFILPLSVMSLVCIWVLMRYRFVFAETDLLKPIHTCAFFVFGQNTFDSKFGDFIRIKCAYRDTR